MLICQLSDLHIRPAGQRYKGVADSNRMLGDAIRHIHTLDVRPDLVVLTGDIVDHGHPDEYAHARALLADLTIPYLVMPGNHDDRDHLRAAFADHAYLPATGPLHYCIDTHPVRLIALDAAGLDWLRTTLAQDTARPTVVMLHHPPFVSGIPYMDAYRLRDAASLAEVIGAFRNIEAVLCGHVHRSMFRRWAGTVVCACPSTTTEIALRLAPDAKPASFMGPPACMLHRWDPADGLVSHTSYIGDFEGPYDFY
ncbi:phosphodiesterase [Variovorax sp. LT1P1]|uniref:phosphodiesterase n=1 Tax=Variovorax sp. LT1P1 TaxID=3443730 RepID=UPI003F44FF4A